MKNGFLIPLILMAVAGCRHADDLFKSYGPETTEIRQVGAFNKILAGEKFDVVLVQDSAKAGTVEMTAGAHVIAGYTSIVHDGELRIANDNKYNWVRTFKVRQKAVVYFTTLDHIQINGSAKFTCRDSIINRHTLEINHGGLEDADLNVTGDYIYVNGTNTGGVYLRGKCFLMSASVDDISFVNAIHLNAEKCYISSFSKDDSYVNGEVEMDVKLYGSGNIFYKLQAATLLKIEDPGKGKAIRY